eukprot:TRINITY_DN18450_c0_g1_i11.p1 TRINITY_DN18450_c0_g1~~TRINITY_DN18450_c0_g1_i11.p1  ORF type:complete len:527 (+),score=156.54 TRINITY_DN18450_c0_g1_i11:74-1654(+)
MARKTSAAAAACASRRKPAAAVSSKTSMPWPRLTGLWAAVAAVLFAVVRGAGVQASSSPPDGTAAKPGKAAGKPPGKSVDPSKKDKWAACSERDLKLFNTPLVRMIKALKKAGVKMPVFDDAAKCVELDEAAASEMASKKRIAKALRCWQLVIEKAPKAPDSMLQLSDGSGISTTDFWQVKRLEMMRDLTGLSAVNGRVYETLRHGALEGKLLDKAVSLALEGLEDPLMRCDLHWLLAFDRRDAVYGQALWRKYAELIIMLGLLNRPEVNALYEKAVTLADNRQNWQNVLSVHAQLPGIRHSAFWDKSEFPWLLKLEDNFETIKRELMQIKEQVGFSSFVSQELPEKKDSWQEMTLFASQGDEHGRINAKWNEKTCASLAPVTCSLLRRRPELDAKNLRVPDAVAAGVEELRRRRSGAKFAKQPGFELMSPKLQVKFYLLQPGAFLRPHFGSHGRLAAHLGIEVPEDCCTLRVGNETRGWQEGKLTIFDDSFVHEARNSGSKVRIVLGVFFLHPDLLATPGGRSEL